jgi:hypothetical protein
MIVRLPEGSINPSSKDERPLGGAGFVASLLPADTERACLRYLLRFGVSAIYSALREMNPDGSLPREMLRGSRRMHYQNYAALYLVFIAELLERQGYPIYDMTVDGRSLHRIIDYTLDALDDPEAYAREAGENQNL